AVTRNRGPPVPMAAQVHSYHDSGDTAAIDELVDASRRQFRFTYDGRGQLLGASDGIGYAAEYAYSPGGRLLGANVNGGPGAASPGRDVEYAYDPAAPERVLALLGRDDGQPHVAYAYDLAGNVTARHGPAGDLQLIHDGAGQLCEVRGPVGRAVHAYDAAGRRVLVLEYGESGQLVRPRRWMGDVERECEGGSGTRRLHITLGTPVARILDGEDGQRIEYLHHRALGPLLLALDETGRALAGFSYSAFGELLEQIGAPERFSRRFNGQELDAHSGLYYYGHRYYDPESHLWTAADPFYLVVPDAAAA